MPSRKALMPSRKALVIGLNYPAKNSLYKTCWDDTVLVENFLKDKYNFPPENISIMKDDGDEPSSWPTAQKIIDALTNLCDQCRPGDTAFLYFAGLTRKDDDGKQGLVGSDDEIVSGDYMKTIANGFARKCRLTIGLDAYRADKIFEDFFMETFDRAKDPRGVVLFTSCQEDAYSDSIDIKLSRLIHKSGGGKVTNKELIEKVKKLVQELPEHMGHEQHVEMHCTSGLEDLQFLA